jgi:hypothetical protein
MCWRSCTVVEVPDLGADFLEMWRELMLLRENASVPWTLIGAHMVALHGWAKGRAAPRSSRDADVLVNARMVSDGTEKISQDLRKRGFELDGVSPEGIGHRFSRGEVRIDVLGPDGVGARTKLFTVSGARTVAVPGGTQALKRSHMIAIRAGSSDGEIPVPDLLGALLVKLRAIEIDDQPAAQRLDAAFLLSLIEDPDPFEAQLTGTERQWLRRHQEFGDPGSICFQDSVHPSDAATVYRRLARLG